MEFNEQKALEIIKKYDLKKRTLQVWKNRGKIPDQYLNDEYEKPREFTAKEKRLFTIIRDFLKEGYFNLKPIAEMADLKYFTITDYLHKNFITANNLNKLSKALKKERLDIQKFSSNYPENPTDADSEKLREFLRRPEFKLSGILNGYEHERKVRDFKAGKQDIPSYIKREVVQRLDKIAIQMNF